MNRFNLTFSGEIVTGRKPEKVKLRFGKKFAIDDPVRLERFFSGETIILRRNLERKEAAQYFQDMRKLGVVAELVKVTANETADPVAPRPTPQGDSNAEDSGNKQGMEQVARKKGSQAKPRKTAQAAAEKEAKRQVREEAAKIKAEQEEQARLEAEEAARIKAEQEEQARLEAEEAARIKAKQEEQARLEAEEAARVKAEQEEQARREAEEAARVKAEQEEQARREAEEAARVKAEQEEQARREAEEAARIKAQKEEQARLEAQEASRLQAELEQIQREEEAQAAKLEAEVAEKARQAATETARIKADAQRKKAEAERKSLERYRAATTALAIPPLPGGQHKEPSKRRKQQRSKKQTEEPQEHKATQVTAEPADQTSVKQTRGRVKTRLEVPQRSNAQNSATQTRRKRQPGEPNLYQLQAFRNTPEVRSRAERALRHMRLGFTTGAVAALLIIAGALLYKPPEPTLTGARAIAVDPGNGPVILAGESLLLHDRAGSGTDRLTLQELGLEKLQGPMAFDKDGNLAAPGQAIGDRGVGPEAAVLTLMRCDLSLRKCASVLPGLAERRIDGFAINSIDDTLLLADTAAKQLLKVNSRGEILLRKDVPMPQAPVLRLQSGLLFMNSAVGPAISVFRYDDNAFGQQLDEILLLPAAATALEQNSTGDFVWSADAWWVNLINPANGSSGLYRFDLEWNFLGRVETSYTNAALELSPWASKTLVNASRSVAIERYNAAGSAEAPLQSPLLEKLVDSQHRQTAITALMWRSGLLLLTLITLVGMGFGYLQRLRGLVYKSRRERGAQPVDDYEDIVRWIDPVPNRQTLLRRRGASYMIIAAALVLMAIGNSVSALQLGALLIAISGPAIALLLWSRRPPGNIGVISHSLLLVDHRGIYHLGEGSHIHYHGPFLILDDVVVFSGNRLLPAFSPPQVRAQVQPVAAEGVKVDSNTVVVKMLQSHHPLAHGALAIVATTTAALVLLGLQGIF